MPRTHLAAVLIAIALPSVALAEAPPNGNADGPIVSPSQVPSATTTTTTTTPEGTTTTTTTTISSPSVTPVAPVAVEPVLAPSEPAAAPPIAAPLIDDPCGVSKRARWKSRLRGKLSIGFARSHLEMADDSEGTQKSLVARLNGRRGWSVELEMSKLSLGEDRGRAGGGALVKTFGRRKLAPYMIAGGGGGRLDHADGGESRIKYAEAGAGLMVRKKRIAIGVDFRRGIRDVEAIASDDAMATPEPTVMRAVTSDDGRERYVRGRIMAMIQF